MSELIVEQSPVILFRRSAGELSRMEYISNNISQFGYSPEQFLSGELNFKDIVHPDDHDRVGKEVEEYAKADVEEYGQAYRILTKSGEVRWVADKTSVVRNEAGEKTHHKKALILAGEVQKSLLPREQPLVQGFDVAGKNISCDEIGGDYYDFLWRRTPAEDLSVSLWVTYAGTGLTQLY